VCVCQDFSLVVQTPQTPQTPEGSLEEVLASIATEKKQYEQLLQEQKELAACRDDRQQMAHEFRQRGAKLAQTLEAEQRFHLEKLGAEQEKLDGLLREEAELLQEIRRAEEALEEEEAHIEHLRKQVDVFGAVPEREVYFGGSTAEPTDQPAFDMDARILYPLDGGTALITFEEEDVASKILDLQKHQVDLGGECSITVEARPVHLMVPKVVEIQSEVCSRRVLISNLPKMDVEILLNKLELHFSKRKNGGGEVEACDILPDSWTVVLTFADEGVAEGVTAKDHHEVKLKQKRASRVKVTPFLHGTITHLKTEMKECARTALLTGIPDVMEQENLQDLLEIHFQKSSNGGGEIQACLYNPPGQCVSAVFDSVSNDHDT
uniref:NID domain-containing protein n=1 Tax=Mola mola TaxID=94237 RepID=A0A3Q3WGV7_MOLML